MNEIDEYYKEMTIALSQTINSKIKIYLDTKYWIEICDVTLGKKENEDIQQIYLYLKNGVEADQIICPISYRIFKEVLKQSDKEGLKQTIAIIDELSQGTILREEKDRLSLELFNFFYDSLHIKTNKSARENYWDYIINIVGVYIPEFQNLSKEHNLIVQEEWLKFIKEIQLKDMLNTEWKDQLFRFRDMKIDTDMYDLNKHLHSTEHNTFTKMYLSELSGIIEAYTETIKDTFKSVIDNQVKKKNITIPKQVIIDIQPILNLIYHAFKEEKIGRYLPSLDIRAMLHAKLRWNKTQRYKQGDFDDIGHAASALPYYDYFFTERSLHNMVKECKYDEKYNCNVASNTKEVLEKLVGMEL